MLFGWETQMKKRLSMRKIKEVLRLYYDQGLSQNAIAGACRIARATVQDYLRRFQTAQLSWPLPEDMGEAELNAHLFKRPVELSPKPQPDWSQIHQELARKGVTLQLLWQEYNQARPHGYQYSRFCQLYRSWAKSHTLSLRQPHKAGEKLFVDWAGQTMPITDTETGEVRQAQIFVSALGASHYLYVEAAEAQTLENWLLAQVRALRFYGGAPEILVPDNPKTAVTNPCRYEPDLNPSYQEFARHYRLAVIPARVRKPKDKSKVEVGVQVVERWVLAPLRDRTFFSLAELNQALTAQLHLINSRPLSGLQQSRRELFERIDKPVLRPLPATDYEMAHIANARVDQDYHVRWEQHYYSVPCRLVHQVVELRSTSRVVEVYHGGQRVASHPRQTEAGQTTLPEHMPEAHRRMLEWTPSRLHLWAGEIGPNTQQFVQIIFERPQHPEQNYRSGLGFLQLQRRYGSARLEKACQRALAFGLTTYKQVRTILKSGQDLLPLPVNDNDDHICPRHANLRGAQCYQ
jgi:transposase